MTEMGSMNTSRKTLTPLAAAHMQQALQREPQSLDDLSLISGLAKLPTVTRYVKDLKDAGLIHIGAWGRDPRGYPTIRKYSWGAGTDAAKPPAKRTDAERMRDLRELKKKGKQ